MKGTLHRTEKGWVVKHSRLNDDGEQIGFGRYEKLPIHPDYIKYYFLDEDAEGAEVEFEIISKLWGVNDDVISYAKLIRPNTEEVRTDSPMVKRLKEYLDSITPEQFEQEIDDINKDLGYVEQEWEIRSRIINEVWDKDEPKTNSILSRLIDLYIEKTGYGMDMWTQEENAVMTTIAEIISELPQQEISDEEIEKAAPTGNLTAEMAFIQDAKWYREQLKSK